eukprot:TRINITY_DN40280_c0_g1_i1.p1 TRINITY_DN40280_c0_g1~~TRINITY_DN40280_c0_g1_i1.p1  ORF type:complete len:231 (+),score=68.41 TRINITY_DN40280_c0_g1_i1:69-761(+)
MNLDPATWASVDLNEAKDYLARHEVHILFERLAGDLIQRRPENPMAYLADRITLLKQDRAMKLVLVAGIPGSGKTDLSTRLGDMEGCKVLDFSDTDLAGQEAVAGVVGTIASEARASAEGFLVVEGFPRDFTQALALQESLPPSLVLDLHCPYADAEKRLFRQSQFSDDVTHSVDSVKANYRAYTESVVPVLKYYKAQGLVQTLPASKAADAVAEAAKGHILNLQKNSSP